MDLHFDGGRSGILVLQVVSCAQPQQLLQVTLNHLEVLKTMVPLPSTINLIDTVIEVQHRIFLVVNGQGNREGRDYIQAVK